MKKNNSSSGDYEGRSSKIAKTNAYGDREFIYGIHDKSNWSAFLDQLEANFLSGKISHLLDEREMLRRKTEPKDAELIPHGSSESSEEVERRKRRQKILDEDARTKKLEHRAFITEFPEHFGIAIGIVLKKVSTTIRLDLQEHMNAMPRQSSHEDKYRSMRKRLEARWGPNSQTDAIDLRDMLSRLSGDTLGWAGYAKEFKRIVTTLAKTTQRDENGNPILGERPSFQMPVIPPPTASLTDTENFMDLLREATQKYNEDYPTGLPLTYAPSDIEKKGMLLRALGKSKIDVYSAIASHYRLKANEDKPFTTVWEDVERVIEFEARKDSHATGSSSWEKQPYQEQQSSAMLTSNISSGNNSSSNTRYAPEDRRNEKRGRQIERYAASKRGYNNAYQADRYQVPTRDGDRGLASDNYRNDNYRDHYQPSYVLYDANSAQLPCKNCTGPHATRECPSTTCSTCGRTFQSAQERKAHYVEQHATHRSSNSSVRFQGHGGNSHHPPRRSGTPRRSNSGTSNQFNQSVEFDCTSSRDGYESSAQDSVYSDRSGGSSQYATEDDIKGCTYEARMQQSVTAEQPYSTLSAQSSTSPGFNCEEGPFSKPSADDDDDEDGNISYQSSMYNLEEQGPFSEPPLSYIEARQIYPSALIPSPRHLDEYYTTTTNVSNAYVAMPIPRNGYVRSIRATNDPTIDEDREMEVISINEDEWAAGAEYDTNYWPELVVPIYCPHPTIFKQRRLLPKLPQRYTEQEIQVFGRYHYWEEQHERGVCRLLRGRQWTNISNENYCYYNLLESLEVGELTLTNPINSGSHQSSNPINQPSIDDLQKLEQWNRYKQRGGLRKSNEYEKDSVNLSPSRERLSLLHPYRYWYREHIGNFDQDNLGEATRRWMNYRENANLPNELHSPELINRVRVQSEMNEGVVRDSEINDDDLLGIVDTGAQISTIPEMLITVDAWTNSRRPAPPGTAIKYGNNDIQEVYSQVDIGDVLFQVTPNRCSNALISVHQLTELGHAVTFTQDLMRVDDADLQYGMHFKKLTEAREWKMPLSALDKLAKLRLAHPRGPARGSSRRLAA